MIQEKFDFEVECFHKTKDELIAFCRHFNQVFLYGTGEYGKQCFSFLTKHNIAIKGFIVTHKQESECFGLPIFAAEEIIPSLTPQTGIVLSLKKTFRDEIRSKFINTDTVKIFEMEDSFFAHCAWISKIGEFQKFIAEAFTKIKAGCLEKEIIAGRDLITDLAIKRELANNPTIFHLINLFISLTKHKATIKPILTGFEPPMKVELSQDPSLNQYLLEHVQIYWKGIGVKEPYWSVLTAEKFFIDNIQYTKKEFYNSGKGDVEKFLVTLERNNIRLANNRTCIDFGCGLGRLTIWLTRNFDKVYGCDISDSHLEIAKQNLGGSGIFNAEFFQLQELNDIERLPKVDVFFSLIVLQHNPPPIMLKMLEKLIGRLNTGGIGYFQIPTYRHKYQFILEDYLAATSNEEKRMEMHCIPQLELFRFFEMQKVTVLEVMEDTYTGDQTGRSNTFLIQKN